MLVHHLQLVDREMMDSKYRLLRRSVSYTRSPEPTLRWRGIPTKDVGGRALKRTRLCCSETDAAFPPEPSATEIKLTDIDHGFEVYRREFN